MKAIYNRTAISLQLQYQNFRVALVLFENRVPIHARIAELAAPARVLLVGFPQIDCKFQGALPWITPCPFHRQRAPRTLRSNESMEAVRRASCSFAITQPTRCRNPTARS